MAPKGVVARLLSLDPQQGFGLIFKQLCGIPSNAKATFVQSTRMQSFFLKTIAMQVYRAFSRGVLLHRLLSRFTCPRPGFYLCLRLKTVWSILLLCKYRAFKMDVLLQALLLPRLTSAQGQGLIPAWGL